MSRGYCSENEIDNRLYQTPNNFVPFKYESKQQPEFGADMQDDKEYLKAQYDHPPNCDDFEIIYEKSKKFNKYV